MRKGSAAAAVLGCFLACVAAPNRAQAASFTFVFDYHIASGSLTGPSGPWGSVTISDSTYDPNRVDIFLTITPPAGFTQLNQFFLNLDLDPDTPPVGTDPDFLSKHLAYLVPTTNPAGDLSGSLGAVGYANGNQCAPTPCSSFFALNGFLFDLNPNPTSTALTFAGSFALYKDETSPTLDTPVNLNANMFFTPSAFTTSGGQTIPMFAAYRSDSGPNTTEFRAFASSVPEPTSLALLSLGLLGVARLRRRR